jgi:hypothetical protein
LDESSVKRAKEQQGSCWHQAITEVAPKPDLDELTGLADPADTGFLADPADPAETLDPTNMADPSGPANPAD